MNRRFWVILLTVLSLSGLAVAQDTRARGARSVSRLPAVIARDVARLSAEAKQCLRDEYRNQINDFAAALAHEALTLDLNADKRPDYLVHIGGACGGPPNTDSFIFGSAGANFKVMWQGTARYFNPLRTSTGGRLDIEKGEHSSAIEQEVAILKYNKGRYYAKRCFTRTISEDENGDSHETVTPHPCR